MARGQCIKFKTRRGKKVSFRLTGRGHRKTAWMKIVGRAGKACKRHGKIGSQSRTSCLKSKIKQFRAGYHKRGPKPGC